MVGAGSKPALSLYNANPTPYYYPSFQRFRSTRVSLAYFIRNLHDDLVYGLQAGRERQCDLGILDSCLLHS